MVFVCGMSRSGTTLLTTILDSHSRIEMGYELIPPAKLRLKELADALDRGMELADGDWTRCAPALRKAGQQSAATFFLRSLRMGLDEQTTRDVLQDLVDSGMDEVKNLDDRLKVAWKLIKAKAEIARPELYGFKLNVPSVATVASSFSSGWFVYILRDPRDVVASHIKRGFKRTTEQVCIAWNNYLKGFCTLQKQRPQSCALVRYEDLVTRPRRALNWLMSRLPVKMEENQFQFHASGASVHGGLHPNAEQLSRGFFTGSIGRWKDNLSEHDVAEIEKLCRDRMFAFGYRPSSEPPRSRGTLLEVPKAKLSKLQKRWETQRKRDRKDYETLLDPYRSTHECLTLREYAQIEDIEDRRILLIRHDVDHDHLTAVKIARWEAEHGYRSTFCLLHTAPYYGQLQDGEYLRTVDMLECAKAIAECGHEVCFHNNMVSVALKEGLDPAELLHRELDFFRERGIDIVGTATHGDALCRELNYRNWELFAECCDSRFGGPRIVEHRENGKTNRVELGKWPLGSFGLLYEAYDISRDVYLTDSGGNLRERVNTRGRYCFGRLDKHRGQVVGVLTHPVWWRF